jgi:hypothetical protein
VDTIPDVNVAEPDPEPGSGFLFEPWITGDPGWKKSRDRTWGSGMNIPDLIFENLLSVLWLKILKFFSADPNPGSFKNRFRD